MLALSPIVGVLALPSYFAVRRVLRRRFIAPLERDGLEALIVFAAAVAGACSAVLYADGVPAAIGMRGRAVFEGQMLLALVAPAPMGAIPWAAGELASGESKRQRLAFLCSIAVAYAVSICGLLGPGRFDFDLPVSIAIATHLGTAALAASSAAISYLAVRGDPLAPAPPEAVAILRVLSDSDLGTLRVRA